MSSDPPKLHRKRPADSEGIDLDDSPDKPDEDFKIKTLDEILQEKRRRIEKDDANDERSEASEGNSRIVSPAASGKRESRTSSKQGSPLEGGSEIIYELSPEEQLSLSPMSSTSGTPNKVKGQSSYDDEPAGTRVRRGRKTTEEEEGEIVSDVSDSESKGGDKGRRYSTSKGHGDKEGAAEGVFASDQSDSESRKSEKKRKYSSSGATDADEKPKEVEMVSDLSDSEDRNLDQPRKYSSPREPVVEEKAKSTDLKEKDSIAKVKSEESSDDDDSNEEESEDDTETATATKRMPKEIKATGDNKQESSESESGSEESSSDDDDDDDGDDDDDEGKDANIRKESGEIKQQKDTQVKQKEAVVKGKVQDNEESSSEEEDSSEEDSDEESDSESSEESEEEEEETKKVTQRTEQVAKSKEVDEIETEDLHSELQQLKRQKSVDEKYKQKSKTMRHHRDERSHRRREQGTSDARVHKERNASEKEKVDVKYQRPMEKSLSRSDSKSRPHEKSRSADKVDSKQKDGRDKHKLSANAKEITKSKSDRASSRDKYSEMEVDRKRKISRKDSEKRKTPDGASRTEGKVRDRKDHSRSRRKASTSEKANKDSKFSVDDVSSSKSKKDEGPLLILTDRERRQFSNEIVDIDSEGSSVEDEQEAAHSDVERKEQLSGGEHEDEKEKEAKLPPYYPAVRGCRNVEEFQWLNRIEEGTYGVVYRAKDKRTGDIVALKKLKMEREKEGFPITSLREINTLLKAQHPNIVTVREIVVGSNMDKIYIVMDYVEHDLKVLMEHMTQGFRIGEVKTLMIQLLRAVAHLHDNWILHRDLKASNLLLSNKGILKVGDFGLAREYGSPLKNYTPVVVTLWYRAPELLLGTKEYSTPIDLWSVGCIFAELLTMKPLFPGKSEIDEINRIFKELGTPSDKIWPGPPSYSELPAVKKMTFTEYPYNNLRNKFGAYLTDKGFDLLNRFLTYDPKRRITADDALKHEYFQESPLPVDPSMFPTWPAKSEMMKRPKKKDVEHSPQAPEGGAMFAKLADEGDSGNGSQGFRMPTSKKGSAAVAGFTLKF